MLTILVIGPAGAGKTILSNKLAEWMIKNMYLNVGIVNLDPGIENLPYEASFDIRKYFTIKDIMNELNLGPNGAFIEAANRIVKIAPKIVKEIASLNHEYIIVDTPGQMEVFVFRNFGPEIAKELLEIYVKYIPETSIAYISAIKGIGIEYLYDKIRETFCECGET